MTEGELTDRENSVLQATVVDFVKSARPVGSRQISKKYEFDVSSATIRNTMSDLEEMGYLTHPHTSAGRLPTDKGYRYYVDMLMRYSEISPKDRDFILLQMDPNAQDIEAILGKTSRLLGQLSEELGIVLAPKLYSGILEKLQLVEIASDKMLVVIKIKSGIVKTVVLEISHSVPREHLDHISTLLNERLAGLSLEEIKQTIDERFQSVELRNDEIAQLLVQKSDSLFEFADKVSIHVYGAKNIITQPELQDPEKISSFMELMEHNEFLADLFGEHAVDEDELVISIGSENKRAEITDYSIVTSTYSFGNLRGQVAILGPTRMHYDKIASLVQLTANLMSEKLN